MSKQQGQIYIIFVAAMVLFILVVVILLGWI